MPDNPVLPCTTERPDNNRLWHTAVVWWGDTERGNHCRAYCKGGNMSDYIDRHAAIDAFYKYPNIDWTTLDVLAKINALPSADVQPVVRCKDCKYRIPITTRGGYFTYICAIEYEISDPYDLTRNVIDGNWYCADGERKVENND